MCPCLFSYISCYNMQYYLSYKPCLTFTLPKLLNEYKPLSDVSYGYCWKCSAVNYQLQCTGKICQEMIQKLLWSTLASQTRKNKVMKKAFLIVLTSSVLRCIWVPSSPLTRDGSLKLILPRSASELLGEEKLEVSHPFLLVLLTRIISSDEDDGISEEGRGVCVPEWLRWPVTPFGKSVCLQLASSTPQSLCCPRNVGRSGCPGDGISQYSRMHETFMTAQWMQQGD